MPVEPTGDGQPLGGRGSRDELHDRFVVAQRFAAPVRRDEREEPVLDLVPLAGPGREVAGRDRALRVIGQALP